ncbi:hypothetical protein [Cellvibrio sp. NN19]|uniref:hypothetical protein n=1 Tax=Cellvibrio chitinivorans TaxID=3102792 RepID=UPI002B400EFB|nr:hypothetical protein [Cellvibrio sp. NN19]
MEKFKNAGKSLRAEAKVMVRQFMEQHELCAPNSSGLKQAEIFRECGLDWSNKPKATSSNQQYWLVALLKELEEEGVVEQVNESGPWRLLAK